MPKASINLSPLLVTLRDEAERIGVSFPALLTADLARYRELAEAAVPAMDEWEWSLLAHIASGLEHLDLLSGVDAVTTPDRIAAEAEEWLDSAADDEIVRAGEFLTRMAKWSPLAMAGVMLRLRRQQ